MKTYEVVAYIKGERVVRIGNLETMAEAQEMKEAAEMAFQVPHKIEEHKEPKETVKGKVAKGIAYGAALFITAVLGGYGRRD